MVAFEDWPPGDWPDETVGFYDDAGNAWCTTHPPQPGEYKGELAPALSTDDWLIQLGICAHEECGNLIADFAPDD